MPPHRRLALLGLAVLLGGLVLLGRSLPARAQVQVLSVGVLPTMAVVDTPTQQAVVANSGDNTVSLLDLASGRVRRTIRVGPGPSALAVDERRGRVLVLNSDSTVSLLDTGTGLLRRTVPVGTDPLALAIDERSGHAVVANSGDNTVSLLDVWSGRLLRTVRVGALGAGAYVVVDAAAHRAFVGTRGDPQVSVLDTRSGTVLGVLHSGDGITSVGVDGRTGRAFLVHSSDSRLSVVDTRRLVVVRTVQVGAGATRVVVDERAGHVVVVNSGDGTLSLLDARSGRVGRTIALRAADPSAPLAAPLVVDAEHAHVFVLEGSGPGRWGAAGGDAVSMLDSRSGRVLRQWRVAAGSVALALALDGARGQLLVLHDADAVAPAAPSGLWGRVVGGLHRTWQRIPPPLRAWLPGLPALAPPAARPYTGSVTLLRVPTA